LPFNLIKNIFPQKLVLVFYAYNVYAGTAKKIATNYFSLKYKTC